MKGLDAQLDVGLCVQDLQEFAYVYTFIDYRSILFLEDETFKKSTVGAHAYRLWVYNQFIMA